MAEEGATGTATAEAGIDGVTGDVSFLYDVPVTMQVMLGEATLTIGDIMKCGKGSVIPLKQKVGDPFVVLLQNRVIAEGEVVAAGEHLGIKITNVHRSQPAAKE
ncbi:MAG: FliM/FliN family flagellar motor switch protein [Deltaproteobacteria bacterium]|nr:FliM/FliN family flagellar motor switch protein [Deltaproteobacteria bacterium]